MRTPRLEGATGHPHSSGGGRKIRCASFFREAGKVASREKISYTRYNNRKIGK